MKYNTLSINTRIGLFTRKQRILLGLSEKKLGRKLNLSQQHISRLERGQTVFSFELVLRLLNLFDKSLFDLISDVFYEDTCEILIQYQYHNPSNTELELAD